MKLQNASLSLPRTPHVEPARDHAPIARRAWQEAPAAGATVAGLSHDARLPDFIGGPSDVRARLRGLTVAVIGAGSIGSRVIDSFARMGIAGLLICDPRSTKVESLITHPISPAEVAEQKAELTARLAKSISPTTRVRFFCGSFQSLPLDALADADLVVVATDNLAVEVAVTQACLHLGKSLFQASVYGAALVAQVRAVSGGEAGAGPCLSCSFGATEWDDLDRDTRFSCEGERAPGAGAAPAPSGLPTTSPPHLCALAAALLVGETLRHVLALGPKPDSGHTLLFSGYTGDTTTTVLLRNPDCPIDHTCWSVRVSDAPLAEVTPRDLARIAGHRDADLRGMSLRIEHHRFASLCACECDAHPQWGRFVADDEELGCCESCGSEKQPHPLYTHRDVPFAALEPILDRSLADLAVSATPTVLVRGAEGATLVRSPAAAFPSFSSSTSSSGSSESFAPPSTRNMEVTSQ